MRLFLLFVLLGASLAVAQSADASKNGRIEGRVVSTTGDPVKGATLTLVGRPGQPGQPGPPGQAGQPVPRLNQSSDALGKFAFDAVAPGTYTCCLAQKDGFSRNAPAAAPITLSAGQVVKDLVIKLTPLGVITGRVTDPDGDPVTNAQVRVMRYMYVLGVKQLTSAGAGQSDDKGNFRIFNLEPGRYYVNAMPRPSLAPGGPEPPRESNVATYYPNSLDTASATPVSVTAGSELAGMDIHVRKARVYSIRGKATGLSSEGTGAVTFIRTTSKEDSSFNSSSPVRPPDGTFEFRNLMPGSYVLQVRPNPQPPGVQTNAANAAPMGRLEVTVKDADVEGQVLELTPTTPFEITGSISLEGGDMKQLTGTLRGLPLIMLREVEVVGPLPRPETKDDGTFRIPGILPGKYSVDFTALQAGISALSGTLPQGVFVKSVRFGGEEITDGRLDLTSGAGGSLQVVLSGKAAAVTGTVRDSEGHALPSTRVILWPKTRDPFSMLGGVRPGIADLSGVAHISGLAPGDYYLAAFQDADPNLLNNPDFLNLITRDASSVKLSENANESVDVKPVSPDKVAAAVAALP